MRIETDCSVVCFRGFAVVFAEDIPDIPSTDEPPGESASFGNA
jgi:hypothetical protein